MKRSEKQPADSGVKIKISEEQPEYSNVKPRKTIFDFLAHVMIVYGFITLVLNIFTGIVGYGARGYSSVFSLEESGIAVSTSFQFLAFSAVIVLLRYLFFTDLVIRRMALWLRRLLLFACVTAAVALFSYLFGWFPVSEWQAWGMFYLFFGVSFLISSLVMSWKEKLENRQLQKALDQYKKDRLKEGRR